MLPASSGKIASESRLRQSTLSNGTTLSWDGYENNVGDLTFGKISRMSVMAAFAILTAFSGEMQHVQNLRIA